MFQILPALDNFYFGWEKDFKIRDTFLWIQENSWLPIMSVILYLSFLVEGKR